MWTRYVAPIVLFLMLAGMPVLAAEHGAAGEGGGAAAAVNPLTWQTNTAIWTAAVFVLLLVVLQKYAWRPIAEGLDKREKRIADDIAAAERSNQEARQLLAQYQERLAGAEGEIREMIERGRREAEKVGHELIEKARVETQTEKERALREIDTATTGALKELADRSAALAVDLAGKIVQSRLDPKAHSRLIEQAVAQFVHSHDGNN